ncbi:universal stress protein [Pontibacter anaerobius]|uniref:Universal stress protein n=1 Tax=Pontibacter anaerobius TaxID=2993940 RepID=A0ABT3RAX3_9BACT|nr:universal stress protein [Pontibacter anaerobius]MCX2738769.1 universal stress protein [Pontibacter anaerobius]
MFKILIPVDFTDSSTNACRYALHMGAALPQAEILLLHCFSDYLLQPELDDPVDETGRNPLSPGSEIITDRVLHRNQMDEQEKLESLYKEMQAEARIHGQHIHLKHAFINGLPEEIIPDEISRFRPNLLLMGTKGEDNVSRSLFGTITTKMVENAKVPLLTVPEPYKQHSLSHVLYATDFDKTDAEALTALMQLLQPFNSEILCAHIGTEDSERDDSYKMEQLQARLYTSIPDHKLQFAILPSDDDVADALQEFVKREQVGLVAVNNHQRSLFSSIFKPSLSKKLVLEAQVPMLIFHSSEKA